MFKNFIYLLLIVFSAVLMSCGNGDKETDEPDYPGKDEPATPYPTDYTECTQVARAELDNNARPAIRGTVGNFDSYDIIFIGCPVWWHTTPMIINTFTESYNFDGKIVVPFCTYASTYRDETLANIVALTPKASHLQGFGSTGSTSGVENWLRTIEIIK